MWIELSTHTCAHKAPHRAEGSGGGKQRGLVCDQGGARGQLSLCCSISTQCSVSKICDFASNLPGCYKGIFFNVGKIKLN